MDRRLTQVKRVEVVDITDSRNYKTFMMFTALAKTELGDFRVTGKTTAELVAKARELYKMAKKRGYI